MAISRRTLLKRIGVAGTAAVVPVPVATPGGHDHAEMQAPSAAVASREAYETLTAPQVDSINTFDAPRTVAPKPISATLQSDKLVLKLEPKSVTVISVAP